MIVGPILLAVVLQTAPKPEPLDFPVLRVGEHSWSGRQVIVANPWHVPSLLEDLKGDAIRQRQLLHSPIFLRQTRALGNRALLDAANIPTADEEAVLREAKAWLTDRSGKSTPRGALVNNGLEISVRARLLSQQQTEFGTVELRQHMLKSVPEFFGELYCSWIRLPLLDTKTGQVFSSQEREKVWDSLNDAATRIQAGDLDWKDAVEEWGFSPRDRDREGRIGFLRRTMTERYEEAFLRPLFQSWGYLLPNEAQLRGPILTDAWAYLVRVETVRTRGAVVLELARDRIERSLRESLLQESLMQLRKDSPLTILLPVSSPPPRPTQD